MAGAMGHRCLHPGRKWKEILFCPENDWRLPLIALQVGNLDGLAGFQLARCFEVRLGNCLTYHCLFVISCCYSILYSPVSTHEPTSPPVTRSILSDERSQEVARRRAALETQLDQQHTAYLPKRELG